MAMRSPSTASMSRRTLGVVPEAWTSKRPASMAPALRSTSGGWITVPALVSAASRTSWQGRIAGKSAARRSMVSAVSAAGNTPVGRLAARTGAATSAGPVLRAR